MQLYDPSARINGVRQDEGNCRLWHGFKHHFSLYYHYRLLAPRLPLSIISSPAIIVLEDEDDVELSCPSFVPLPTTANISKSSTMSAVSPLATVECPLLAMKFLVQVGLTLEARLLDGLAFGVFGLRGQR